MSEKQQASSKGGRKPGTPGRFSLWMQRSVNGRTNRKIRRGKGHMMGMDMLILHTVGKRSGQPRETPLAWYADGDARLVVASGGGSQHPGWHANLTAHPDQVSIELPGHGTEPVTVQHLDGAERDTAWQRITEANPRMAKYQQKSAREYPVLRLVPRG